VECNPEFLTIQPYPIEQFEIFLANADLRQHGGVHSQDTTLSVRFSQRSLTTDALAGLYRPAFGVEIVKHCGQLQKLRDTGGNLPDPVWHAGLGVLAF
jgi:hypothetical protein